MRCSAEGEIPSALFFLLAFSLNQAQLDLPFFGKRKSGQGFLQSIWLPYISGSGVFRQRWSLGRFVRLRGHEGEECSQTPNTLPPRGSLITWLTLAVGIGCFCSPISDLSPLLSRVDADGVKFVGIRRLLFDYTRRKYICLLIDFLDKLTATRTGGGFFSAELQDGYPRKRGELKIPQNLTILRDLFRYSTILRPSR